MGTGAGGEDTTAPVVDDAMLWDEIEKLLQEIAGQVGRRSVEPHLRDLKHALNQHAGKLTEHHESAQQHLDVQQQALTAHAQQQKHLLDEHHERALKLADEQTAVLTMSLAQAERRELDAQDIIAAVDRAVKEGLAAGAVLAAKQVKEVERRLEEQTRLLDERLESLNQTVGVLVEALAAMRMSIDVAQAALQPALAATALAVDRHATESATRLQAVSAEWLTAAEALRAAMQQVVRQADAHETLAQNALTTTAADLRAVEERLLTELESLAQANHTQHEHEVAVATGVGDGIRKAVADVTNLLASHVGSVERDHEQLQSRLGATYDYVTEPRGLRRLFCRGGHGRR